MTTTADQPSAPHSSADDRLDPRVKWALSLLPPQGDPPRFATRDEAVAAANSPAALEYARQQRDLMLLCDTDEVAPSAGLSTVEHRTVSQPDGNEILVTVVRPDDGRVLPCVYYIHGGGMASLSSTMGNYRAWARIVARHGVAVALVEFRNSMQPGALPEIAPFPGGLNDCASGLRWLHQRHAELGIDPSRVVVAGESGGGNLAIALAMRCVREGSSALVAGLYALCPYIVGEYPRPELASTVENHGIFINLDGNGPFLAYGAEHARNPLAWPYWATEADLAGMPPTVVSVNECDPLRDEGIAFYRRLLAAGVQARCREVKGTMHATEVIPIICPEITADAAAHLAAFATGNAR